MLLRGILPVLIPILFVWTQGVSSAQKPLITGKEIFEATCVGCHGVDGKGAPQNSRGFEAPNTFPDFSDCNGTARESNIDWRAVIHHGGPGRGFSEIMPSFEEALTAEQIDKLVDYLRSFCVDKSYPRGELNLPRAFFTEKAFPEDETVLTTAVNTNNAPGVASELVYERRFGVRNQVEVAVPLGFNKLETNTWFGGIGDIRLGYKRPLVANIRTGSIFSLSGEITLPTGNRQHGLGGGTAILESFAAYGQLLPKNAFLQFQSGVEVPTRSELANKAVFVRSSFGKSFEGRSGIAPMWSPMVEFIADREFATGEKVNWDIVPEMQVTLSRRRHIRAAIGLRTPLNNAVGRSTQIVFYLLWDWFDGGLREGWR